MNKILSAYYNICYSVEYDGTIGLVQLYTKNKQDRANLTLSNGGKRDIPWIDFCYFARGITKDTIWHDERDIV